MSLIGPQNPYTPTTVSRGDLGSFQIIFKSPKGVQRDYTYLRDVPAVVDEFSSGDPFGDAACVVSLPQVSPFEAWGSGELAALDDWSEVSIYRVPDTGPKKLLFRGFVASFEVSDQGVQVSCIGAMYQLDLYVKRPYYYEDFKKTASMIVDEFKNRPHLRMNADVIVQPSGKRSTLFGSSTPFKTRNHGAWERVLTGYIQDQLASMVDLDTGEQWTLTHDSTRRRPVFRLRGDNATTWTVDLGAPGVTANLSKDLLQSVNVIYGEGTDEARNTWRNAVEAQDGSFTDYRPLSYDPQVHVTPLNLATFRSEAFYNFGNNFGQDDAQVAARKFVARDRDASWVGTVDLDSDPLEGVRLDIRAGDKLVLRNFRGENLTLHIASMTCSLSDNGYSVSLKVDQRNRDLLTLEEVIARNRDSKTPSRLLQVGRESQTINDKEVPWDYDAGSGFVPLASKEFNRSGATFPYTTLTNTTHQPGAKQQFYVFVRGSAASAKDRWRFVKVLMSEQGSIRYTEFALYDEYGAIIQQPFHVSIYPNNYVADDPGSWRDMPQDDNGNPTPFVTDAFREVDGVPVARHGHPELIIGWGDADQRAGYWPGLDSEGDPVTGKLVDESTWQYSLDRGHKYVTVAIYAEVDCYVMGRMVKADTMPERPILVGQG